ncbi:MAG: hypothetical protein NVS3B20_23130 [Polyangiales bacterium]
MIVIRKSFGHRVEVEGPRNTAISSGGVCASRSFFSPLTALVLVTSFGIALSGCPGLTRPTDEDPGLGNNAFVPGKPPAAGKRRPLQMPSPSGAPAADAPGEVRASHILVGWKGAAGPPAQRSKEEARVRVEEILARLKKGEDFAALASEYGEDGTKTRGGDLNFFKREAMVKPFSDAAFALAVGEVSGVVETKFGFHLIKRTQ